MKGLVTIVTRLFVWELTLCNMHHNSTHNTQQHKSPCSCRTPAPRNNFDVCENEQRWEGKYSFTDKTCCPFLTNLFHVLCALCPFLANLFHVLCALCPFTSVIIYRFVLYAISAYFSLPTCKYGFMFDSITTESFKGLGSFIIKESKNVKKKTRQ